MPELPEVETIARSLRPQLIGRKIIEADVRWARTVAMPSVKKFKEQVKGQKIVDVSRRAKFLNIQLQAYNLLIHLRMSGDVLVRQGKIEPEKHDRLILTLAPSISPKFKEFRGREKGVSRFQRHAQVWTRLVDGRYGKSIGQARARAAKSKLYIPLVI